MDTLTELTNEKYPQALMGLYLNRKNYHLINVQGICDANLNSLHYGKMAKLITGCYYWANSALNRLFDTVIIAEGWLLGDSSYPLSPWYM